MFSHDLDSVANEMEQGFQQRGGRKACRYLLGKIVEEEQAEVERLREAIQDIISDPRSKLSTRSEEICQAVRGKAIDPTKYVLIERDTINDQNAEVERLREENKKLLVHEELREEFYWGKP